MPLPKFPAVLVPSAWEKQKATAGRATELSDPLKALAKSAGALDGSVLDTAGLSSAEEIERRMTEVSAFLDRKVEPVADEATKVAAVAKKCKAVLDRDPAGKVAAGAVLAVQKAATTYAEEIVEAVKAVQSDLKSRLAEAARAEKGKGKGDQGTELTPAQKGARAKLLAALRTVKSRKPAEGPMACMISIGPDTALAWVAPTVGASQKTVLSGLMDGQSGLKFYDGQCVWERNAYTFVGEDIPKGVVKKLQAGLLSLLGVKLAIRVRNKAGVAEEAEGQDVPDDQTDGEGSAPQVSDSGPSAVEEDPARAFNAHLAELLPLVKEAVAAGGPNAQNAKLLVSQAGALARSSDFARAEAMLVDARALLSAAPGNGAGTAGAKTMPLWQRARDAAVGQIGQLQSAMRDSGHPVLTRIADQGLNAITQRLQVGLQVALMEFDSAAPAARVRARLQARRAIGDFRTFLDGSGALDLLERNPLGVNVTIRNTLSSALDAVERVIAD